MNRDFWVDFGRAGSGALLFSFPLLMTMETWWLGFYADRLRLALFLAMALPLVLGLSRYSGLRETVNWFEDIVDAFVAYAAGSLVAALFLLLFNVVRPGIPLSEAVGKIALLTVPGAIGAVVSQKQLGERPRREPRKSAGGYGRELFLMAAGAVYVSLTVAPTEEMMLIAYRMTPWHAVALVAVTLAIMHGLVYGVEFRGQERPRDHSALQLFVSFTVVGYVVALLVSLFLLWSFDRMHDPGTEVNLMQTVVLGLPGGLGAALARLVV